MGSVLLLADLLRGHEPGRVQAGSPHHRFMESHLFLADLRRGQEPRRVQAGRPHHRFNERLPQPHPRGS